MQGNAVHSDHLSDVSILVDVETIITDALAILAILTLVIDFPVTTFQIAYSVKLSCICLLTS